MTQTETVTRMALEERVRPVLFINKVDRLIKELRLTPEKMQQQLADVVSNFNRLIDTYAEPELQGEVEGLHTGRKRNVRALQRTGGPST